MVSHSKPGLIPEIPTNTAGHAHHSKALRPNHDGWNALIDTYHPVLLNFVRAQGHSAHDAEDHLQAFFAHLLSKARLPSTGTSRERVGAFLFTALKRFLIDRHRS